MNADVQSMLLSLIRGDTTTTGDTLTTAEIQTHLERLHRMGGDLPSGWQSWPEVLRSMERDGLVRLEGEGWWVAVVQKSRPKQTQMF